MKKQLLTTTAIVAAGMIGATGSANAVKLGLGGFQEGIIGVADQSSSVRDYSAFDVQHDGEIHFKASETLDNGLKIRTRVELESSTQTDQIDEAYVDVSGKWGAIRVGAEDNAAHLMNTPTFGAWATNVGQNTNFDTSDWIIVPSGFTFDFDQRLDVGEGDAEKINYFTPRVAGFQLGVGYMPSGEEDKNGSITPRSVTIADGWAVGANYRGKFGGFGVRGAAGYVTASQPAGVATTNGDPKGFSVSAAFSFAGVTLAGGYQQRRNLGTAAVTDTSSDELSFGAKYDFGKNHVSVGVLYGESPADRTIAGDDQAFRMLASYRRDLAKGIQYRLNVFYADFEGEAAGEADDNDGIAVTTSVRLAF